MIILGVSMFIIGTFISFVSHHHADAEKAARVSRSISSSKKLDKALENDYNAQNDQSIDSSDVSEANSELKSSSTSSQKSASKSSDVLTYFQKSLDARVTNDSGKLISAKATKQNADYYTVKYIGDQHLDALGQTELQAYADELFDSTQKIAAMCGLKYKVGINLWKSDGSTIIARRNANGGVTVYPVAK